VLKCQLQITNTGWVKKRKTLNGLVKRGIIREDADDKAPQAVYGRILN
jgi:hypothetical protein